MSEFATGSLPCRDLQKSAEFDDALKEEACENGSNLSRDAVDAKLSAFHRHSRSNEIRSGKAFAVKTYYVGKHDSAPDEIKDLDDA